MACFSLAWIEQLLIWLVVVMFAAAVIKLVVPGLMGLIGAPPGGGIIVTFLGYVLWAIVAYFVIVFAFDLISCGSGHLGRL